jgi:hypothetical protein
MGARSRCRVRHSRGIECTASSGGYESITMEYYEQYKKMLTCTKGETVTMITTAQAKVPEDRSASDGNGEDGNRDNST